MRALLEQLVWWIQHKFDTRDDQKRNHAVKCLIIILLPILASFVLVQMQQQHEFGLIGSLWNSTALGTASLILSIWHFTLRVVGVSLGIGLGLGFAGHVYDALSDAREGDHYDGVESKIDRGGRARRRSSTSAVEITSATSMPNFPKDTHTKPTTAMEDVNSYHSLMRSAGYSVDNGTLRAQMVRGSQALDAMRANDAKRELKGLREEQSKTPSEPLQPNSQHPRMSIYQFDKGKTASMRMRCMWPNLSPIINDSLAKLTEFVLRDYVSSWYSKVDEHVVYKDPELSSSTTNNKMAPADSYSNFSHISGDNRPSTAPSESERRRTISAPLEVNSSLKDSFRNNNNNKDYPHSFSEGEHHNTFPVPERSNNTVSRSSSFSLKDQHHPLVRSPYSVSSPTTQRKRHQQQQRTMVLTTTGTQPSPFVDSLYSCFAYLLGMLATRASENVNVLELLLLHLPHILGQNLRIYREMKNMALEKKRRRVAAEREKWRKKRMEENSDHSSPTSPSGSFTASNSQLIDGEVSEIAIVREYLLAGRFHRAVTFGLDVPSLLFADPLAKDCPPGPSYQGNSDCDRLNGHPDEDAILYDRLLSPESSLIDECELDYGRVLAAKLTKMTVPKTEVDSSIVRTTLVEMLASCVLGPVMGCFCPQSVNGWIVKGLGLLEDDGKGEATSNASASSNTGDVASASDGIVRIDSDLGMNPPVTDGPNGDSRLLSNTSTNTVEFLDNIVDGVMEEIASEEGSVSSEMEDSLFDMDDDSTRKKEMIELGSCSKAEQIITMLSMAIIELGSFVDFEESRYAREHGQDCIIDWDAQKCRDSVRHLVLVIEAALLFGLRAHPKRQHRAEDRAFSEFEIEATLEQHDEDEFEVDIDEGLVEPKIASSVNHQHSSLSSALMELTGDIDSFERLIVEAEQVGDDESLEDESEVEIVIPVPNELSTLRTLIAAWLHTGQAFKVLSIVARAKQTILRRFYHNNAFLRRSNYASDFTRLLRQLDGVDILVDTMAVLASQCLLIGNGFDDLMKNLQPKTNFHQKLDDPFPEMRGRRRHPPPHSNVNSMSVVGSVKANLVHNRNRIARFAQSAAEIDLRQIDLNPWKDKSNESGRRPSGANIAYNLHQTNSTPAYLAFSTNDVFASSLRSERERRKASWAKEIRDKKKLDFVSRTKGVKDKDIMMHRELHHLSRFFYSNTNEVRIEPCSFGDGQSLSKSAANVTVKAVGARRKIEVPDEDSSFLLRAQPRPLKPVAIQRDQRNPRVACKVYVAMYEEPAIHPKTKRYYGGRYRRQCLMRYYPNDKTAQVAVADKISVLDGRIHESDNFVLTKDFQKLRHTCLKVAAGGILSSPLMEPSDFCSTPRTGRAIDFAHRISLFDHPMVELGGKKFVVHDASSHLADASSLELSDASMTAALILRGSSGLNVCDDAPGSFNIKVSDDGTPLVLLRASRDGPPGSSPKTKDEARPYRPSFIRAALLVKSAKQEAQSQCLHYCIRSGSARSSSKVKSDEWLQPTLTLLQYANSRRQEEQSALLRDLRFGINHIDRGQLSRNGLLNPRYPTMLRGLNTKIEGIVEVKNTADFDLLGSSLILFKIHCTAIAEYVGDEDNDELAMLSTYSHDGSVENKKSKRKTRYFREEWTVLRSLRDFAVFHKHIKGQVSQNEHSATAGAKLVGSVSAALTIVGGNTVVDERQRGPLVPSLSHATKAGTLGLSTKNLLEKRKKLLDQYLKYLVSPKNLLSRCPELLKFLGAYTPAFPPEGSDKVADEYGREDMRRVELVTEKLKAGIVQVKRGTEQVSNSAIDISTKNPGEDAVAIVAPNKAESMDDNVTVSTLGTTTVTQEEPTEKKGPQQNHAARRMARIRAGEIRLKDVRRSIFRLLKHLFNLDNASFFRSRVISVLKTMSVAVASVQDFHLLLFQTHVNYMNGEWISGWIIYLVDMFWPEGVFYKKEPPMSDEEIFDLKKKSKEMLEKAFPDQLRTVLGRHTDEGLDELHEMLQNRLVLKSMAYMIMDSVWVELFPELSDFVTGSECLEKEA